MDTTSKSKSTHLNLARHWDSLSLFILSTSALVNFPLAREWWWSAFKLLSMGVQWISSSQVSKLRNLVRSLLNIHYYFHDIWIVMYFVTYNSKNFIFTVVLHVWSGVLQSNWALKNHDTPAQPTNFNFQIIGLYFLDF